MKEIKLTHGYVALVDDEDFESLNKLKWCVNKHKNVFYAVSRTSRIYGKQKTFTMHQKIMGRSWIDHIDHDGLNNQKYNLRFCNNRQNQMNSRKQKNKSSIYKGVHFFKRDGTWQVQIRINGKRTNLGYFDSEIEAAKAYNNAAIIHYKEFANLNTF